MVDLPILFSAPMVRGLIREAETPGTGKTQTRRLLSRLRRFGPVTEFGPSDTVGYDWHFRDRAMRWHDLRCAGLLSYLPYAVGDRLWVREAVCADADAETWDHVVRYLANDATMKFADCNDIASEAFGRWWLLNSYRSDDPDLTGGKPVPPIHMPRWASRLTLYVTEVRVERLQDISETDAIAEGVCSFVEANDSTPWGEIVPADRAALVRGIYGSHVTAYRHLWETLHGADAWDRNPWVAVIAFRPVLANIDAPAEPLDIGAAA